MASSERVSTAVRTGALVALMAVTAGLLAGQDDPARFLGPRRDEDHRHARGLPQPREHLVAAEVGQA